MNKGSGLFIIALITVVSASSFAFANSQSGPDPLKFKLLHNFGFKKFFDIKAPTYDLSATFRIQSDSVAELNAGKEHVERYINGFKEEIDELDDGIHGIETTATTINSAVQGYENRAEKMIDEATEQAKLATNDKLDKFESDKVDVAETVYEDNVPIQKDIFTHSKELYKDKKNPDSFGVLPI